LHPGRDLHHDVDLLGREIERTSRSPLKRLLASRKAFPIAGIAALLIVFAGAMPVIVRSILRGSEVTPALPAEPPPIALPATKPAEETLAEMVAVPAGSFFMGCNEQVDTECDADERPSRRVDVAAFRIDRTEVTVARYAACVAAGSCGTEGLTMPYVNKREQPELARFCNWGNKGREEHPINCLTWAQAQAYCAWAGRRLPTEVEWEKAARGTNGLKYPWGNKAYGTVGKAVANVADETLRRTFPDWPVVDGYDDGWEGTAPVGSYPAGVSPYGVADMMGYVYEWLADVRADLQVVRGGSWHDLPKTARASYRGALDPWTRRADLGFRCAQ
jgi:formylglycine-generating enzyme required for sulfatase activity